MEDAVREILDALRGDGSLDAAQLDRIVRRHSKKAHDGRRLFAKKHILSYYINEMESHSVTWESWNVDSNLHAKMLSTLQMKPRRTASGVATITVITKPWPCANDCIYCPNDPTMPKSYLRDEPACQRAERNDFDPYRQVASRLHTLERMGHATDKVELIVLGGTWMDYPRDYRFWFVGELFRALNDSDERLPLPQLQEANEKASHRVVGLVVETRPDTVTPRSLREMRELGCTKIQMGVQSIDAALLETNGRRETPEDISRALDLARLFGFKTHTHFMINLLGATPDTDVRDYGAFANDPAYSPDEVKLYPCALVAGTQLVREYENGTWRPYTEEELVTTLCRCMELTPSHMRVSRMIRDISAKDILVGNKKTNLRQLVDEKLRELSRPIKEIRSREIATQDVDLETLTLEEDWYETNATREAFLQWVTPDGRIAGFLRLSLPKGDAHAKYDGLPTSLEEAMIREVHVYGVAVRVGERNAHAQHRGLGKRLVERACAIAAERGYVGVNVISAVGTRDYYRSLGFVDCGLYQRRAIAQTENFEITVAK